MITSDISPKKYKVTSINQTPMTTYNGWFLYSKIVDGRGLLSIFSGHTIDNKEQSKF